MRPMSMSMYITGTISLPNPHEFKFLEKATWSHVSFLFPDNPQEPNAMEEAGISSVVYLSVVPPLPSNLFGWHAEFKSCTYIVLGNSS